MRSLHEYNIASRCQPGDFYCSANQVFLLPIIEVCPHPPATGELFDVVLLQVRATWKEFFNRTAYVAACASSELRVLIATAQKGWVSIRQFTQHYHHLFLGIRIRKLVSSNYNHALSTRSGRPIN